jgi:hypothetical protein
MALVMGLDGGTHTGVCLLDTSKTLVDNAAELKQRSWMFEGRGWRDEGTMAESVVDLVHELGVEVLAVEDFIALRLESSAREGLSSPRVVAMVDALLVRDLGDLYGDDVVVGTDGGVKRFARLASVAKTTWTDPRLRRAGIWKGISAHERDAWRHALTFAKMSGRLRR